MNNQVLKLVMTFLIINLPFSTGNITLILTEILTLVLSFW